MKNDSINMLGGSLHGLLVPNSNSEKPTVPNQLAMHAGSLSTAIQAGANLSWSPAIRIREPALFDFDSFTFISPVSGQYGPSLSTLRANAAYKATSWALDDSLFYCISGIQKFTVPATGIYQVELIGASSGTHAKRCYRAIVSGEFELSAGDQLSILIGQQASLPTGSLGTYGGAGGTFLVRNQAALLAVAGGAGGCTSSVIQECSLDENAGPYKKGTSTAIITPQTVIGECCSLTYTDSAGSLTAVAYGGGGYRGTRPSSTYGASFLEGGSGGSEPVDDTIRSSSGGFGGGGAGQVRYDTSYLAYAYGGGGGYTGGEPSGAYARYGGSGGNFLAAFARNGSIVKNDGVERGNGSLKLTYLG